MNSSVPKSALAYIVAVASLAAALLLRWLLDPVLGDSLPLITLFGAVGITVWIGGYRPALIVMALGYLASAFLFVEPRGQLWAGEPRNIVGLLLFLGNSGIIIGFGEALRRAEQRCRTAEAAACQKTEQLRTTLASIGDGVIATDLEGRVTTMNPVAEALTGWTNEAAVGVPLTQVFCIVNDATRMEVENPALRALREGVVVGLANHTILIAKNGTERAIDDSAAPIRAASGEVLGCVLVFRDISERYLAEAEQRGTREQLYTTLESVTDGFIRYDKDWRIVYVNAEAERINRFQRTEVLGRNLWEVFPAIVGTNLEAEFRRAVAEQVTVEFENYYAPFCRWYALKGYAMPDGGLTTFIRDITDRKRVQQQLADSEARYRAIGESIDFGVWMCDATGRNTYASESFLRMVGITQQQCSDFGWGDVLHPEDTAETIAAWQECVRTNGTWERVHRFKGVDGKWYSVLARGVPLRNPAGESLGWAGINLDITHLVKTELEVTRLATEAQRQRRLYETVLSNTPDFVYVFSLDHKVVYANEALINMWGRGQEGAIGKTFLEIGYEPWHAQMHDQEIDQIRATRQPIRGEVPFNGTNGRRIYDYIFVPIIGADGEVEAVAGTTRDVTERKEAEMQLRESQQQLDFALAAADLGHWSINLADRTSRRTLRHDQLFGYDSLLPTWTYEMFLQHVVPQDRAAVEADFQAAVATGSLWDVECRIRWADGAVRHIWSKALVRRNAQGEAVQMLGIVGDITDRRQAEKQQALLVRIADALRPLSDPVDVQAMASRVLGEHLGANRVLYFEICGNDYVIEREYTVGVRPLAGRYPVAAFGPTLLAEFLEGRTVVEADATNKPDRPDSERAAFAGIQVRGHVDVPLVKGGRFVAGLTVQCCERRDWTQQEVALIEDIAERTWGAVERARVESALRLSEERRRLALEAAEFGAWHIDVATHTLSSDERFRTILTGTPEAMDYAQAFSTIHPADEKRIREAVAAATRSDDPAPYAEEYRVIHPDGSVHWVSAKGRANHAGDGLARRVVSLDGTLAEITARKEAEVRVEESEQRFRLVADAAPVLIWLSDTDKLVSWYNKPWLEFTGRSMDEEVGHGATEVVHPDDIGRGIETYSAAFDARASFSMEYRLRRYDGEFRWMICNGVPRYRADGQFDGYIGSCVDITDYKNAQTMLGDADRRKDEFLATLAHELRNPLAPILNGLHVMRLAGADGRVEQARSMMERQLKQLVRLVDDLLDISRVASGKLELRRERIELRAVIEAAIETSRPALEQAKHEFAVVVPDEPILMIGDPTRLAQLVSNLLNNAAKYTHRGGHVRLEVHLEESMAVLVVADDGIGIPQNMVGRVFEMFTQVDRALEKTTGGLGIGLSLAKRLAEMHGGSIEARSDGEGMGSKFVLRLPVVQTVDQKGDPPAVHGPMRSARRRILVADDNIDLAESLGQLLELLGNEVKTANDGVQATELAEKFRPDVILLDIGMPKLNGFDACRRIRTQPWSKGAIVIAMTGWGQEEDKRRSQEAGFDHHMVKPVDPLALEMLLASLKSEAS